MHFDQDACIYVENVTAAGGFLMKTKCILYMFQRLRKAEEEKVREAASEKVAQCELIKKLSENLDFLRKVLFELP